MFKKLEDIPECLGNIDGVDYDADIWVKITTQPKLREDLIKHLNGEEGYEKIDTISLDKKYHIFKITCYGDVFDVWIINDKGKKERFGEWIFEDTNE